MKRKKIAGKDVKLRCKECKIFACYGSDIYTVDNATHYIVLDKEFEENKILIEPIPSPKQLTRTMRKTHNILCANCAADWGSIFFRRKEGLKLPVLKCANFIFETIPGIQEHIVKWCDVPFEVLPLSDYCLGSQ